MRSFAPFIAVSIALASIAACSMGDPSEALGPKPQGPATNLEPAQPLGPTFHKDIAPIVQAHCQKCHHPGGLGPFSLLTYADAKPMAPLMREETTARRMPPWGAQDTDECKPPLPFNHDARLTALEIKTIADWDAAGAPEGDPKDAPPPRTIETSQLKGATLT